MPLILPLVFFFSDSFYSVAFFFCSRLSSLSLSLLVSILCFFSSSSMFLFWTVAQRGRTEGAGILGGKVGARALVANAFLFLFLFFLRLLSNLPSLGFFFLSFCSPMFACPPFRLLCVSFTPCVLCVHFVSVPCSCFCSSSVYPRGPFYFLSLCFRSSFVPR